MGCSCKGRPDTIPISSNGTSATPAFNHSAHFLPWEVGKLAATAHGIHQCQFKSCIAASKADARWHLQGSPSSFDPHTSNCQSTKSIQITIHRLFCQSTAVSLLTSWDRQSDLTYLKARNETSSTGTHTHTHLLLSTSYHRQQPWLGFHSSVPCAQQNSTATWEDNNPTY